MTRHPSLVGSYGLIKRIVTAQAIVLATLVTAIDASTNSSRRPVFIGVASFVFCWLLYGCTSVNQPRRQKVVRDDSVILICRGQYSGTTYRIPGASRAGISYRVTEWLQGSDTSEVVRVEFFWMNKLDAPIITNALLILHKESEIIEAKPNSPVKWTYFALGGDISRGIKQDEGWLVNQARHVDTESLRDNPTYLWLPKEQAFRLVAARAETVGVSSALLSKWKAYRALAGYGWIVKADFPDRWAPDTANLYARINDYGEIQLFSVGRIRR